MCDYRKEISEGNGDANLPEMPVWSRSRIAGPKSTFYCLSSGPWKYLATVMTVPMMTALSAVPAIIQELSTVGKIKAS